MLVVAIMAAIVFVAMLIVGIIEYRNEHAIDWGNAIAVPVFAACIAALGGVVVAWLVGFAAPKDWAWQNTTKIYPVDKNIYVRIEKKDGVYAEYGYAAKNSDGETVYQRLFEGNDSVKILNEDKNPTMKRYTVIGKGLWRYFVFVPDMGRKKFYVPTKSVQRGFDFEEQTEERCSHEV